MTTACISRRMTFVCFRQSPQQVYMHKEATYSMDYARTRQGKTISHSASPQTGGHVSLGAVGALFLCSVVVGKVPAILGTRNMRDPGAHKPGCITARGSEGALVVFKDFQAIPEYLLSIGTFLPNSVCTARRCRNVA